MRVGTAVVSNQHASGLAIYARKDGSLYYMVDGLRHDLQASGRWVTTSGVEMRGTTPIAGQEQSPFDPVEMEELHAAIDASLAEAEVESVAVEGGEGDIEPEAGQDGGHAASPCVICLTSLRNHICVPCGHLVACGGCARRLGRQCPVCRANASVQRVFF